MKKIFTFLTGILLLATILAAGGCSRQKKFKLTSKPEKVTIHLKSITEGVNKHLKLSDSGGNKAIDYLITVAGRGDTILWKLKTFSKIDKIVRIYSGEEGKTIFKEDAQQQGSENVFTLIVPDDVDYGKMEKYTIIYIHKDKSQVEIDPYIRILD